LLVPDAFSHLSDFILISLTRIAWPAAPWSDCGREEALLLPVPAVLPDALVPEALVLDVPLELGPDELAEVDAPLGAVLLAEELAASHVPFTSTLWPTCALRSSELSS
jgi:hypothetical protein